MSRKVLIVDDEVEVVQIIRKKLEADGFEVVLSYTAQEGLIQARAHLPDVILMDIVLPDMDGPDAVKELHAHPATLRIPVVFLSGIVEGKPAVGCHEITVSGRSYKAIGKPFHYSELKDTVEHLLALTR